MVNNVTTCVLTFYTEMFLLNCHLYIIFLLQSTIKILTKMNKTCVREHDHYTICPLSFHINEYTIIVVIYHVWNKSEIFHNMLMMLNWEICCNLTNHLFNLCITTDETGKSFTDNAKQIIRIELTSIFQSWIVHFYNEKNLIF